MSSSTSTPLDVDTSNNQKYQTKNPIVQQLIGRFLDKVHTHVARFEPVRVADLGCGEGRVLERLRGIPSVKDVLGVEINPTAASAAIARLGEENIRVDNICDIAPPEPQWADVSICLEVLEHLDTPERAVQNIARWTKRAAVISVPWEPFFRGGSLLRGKYLSTFGNHPEHIQQFTPRSLQTLLRTEFPVVEIDTSFPWIVAVCAAPSGARV